MPKPKQPVGRLIPFSKLDDDTVRSIIGGFACSESLDENAAVAKVSVRTCKSIVLALRYRLFRPAFNRWRVLSPITLIHDIEGLDIASVLTFGLLAKCYFKKGCASNYEQDLRKARICRTCPVRHIDDDEEFLKLAVAHIDLVREYYSQLGIGGETKTPKLTVFLLRWAHTHVVGEAYEATRKSDDEYRTPDFTDRGPLTVYALYEALVKELENEPLVRHTGPIGVLDAEYGDLKWLDG